MNAEDLVLGIDGGGSKTVAVLALRSAEDEAEVIGRGVVGASNPNVVGMARTLAVFDEAVAAAFRDAGVAPARLASACVAVAGGAATRVQERLASWAEQRELSAQFRAVHDALPVLAAGTPDGWGIAVIAGTGSLVFGRDAGGAVARAGGWGFMFGDQGSGLSLAVSGLQAVAQAADGTGPATLLSGRMLSRFQVDEPRAIVDLVYHPPWDRTAVATLAEVVCRAAGEGDEVAQGLLQGAARALAEGVRAVAHRLHLDKEPLPLAYAGGLLVGDRLLRECLATCLSDAGLPATQSTIVPQPVIGAVRLAREALPG